MTQLLSISSGQIVLRDTSGAIVFDSNEKLFQATSRVTGSVNVGPWTASYNGTSGARTDVNVDTNHLLASVNSACDTVVGAFQATSSDSRGVVGLGWFNAGGTYMYFHDAATTTRVFAQEMVAFTFFCSGGGLYLNERVVMRAITGLSAPTNTITLAQVTLAYNLYCGSFV